jgi:hypothetical protein
MKRRINPGSAPVITKRYLHYLRRNGDSEKLGNLFKVREPTHFERPETRASDFK